MTQLEFDSEQGGKHHVLPCGNHNGYLYLFHAARLPLVCVLSLEGKVDGRRA